MLLLCQSCVNYSLKILINFISNCYLQCPNNSTVQSELTGTIEPAIEANCRAANLNPSALPNPPPWQSSGLVFSTISASNPSSTASPTDNSNADQKENSGDMNYSILWVSSLSLCIITLITMMF